MKTIATIFCFMCFAFPAIAEKVFDFNSNCKLAYKEITSLRLKNGQQLIQQERQRNPDNLIPELLESSIDFFELFLNEDPAEYKVRKEKFEQRLALLQQGPKNSPFYLYGQAALHLQRACIRVKFGEKFNASFDFKKGYGLVKDNSKLFPDFQPNDLVFGPLKVGIGTIPSGYRWAVSLFGMKGSVTEGMQMMRKFINSNDPWAKLMYNEAVFYYCYLMFYVENKQTDALDFIHKQKLDVVNNHLFTYMAGNLGINAKQTEYAKSVILNRNTSAEYMQTTVWDFELGFAHLYHLETQQAIFYFERFLKNFKGKFYVKDVLLKLSWAYYLQGNTAKAEELRKQILSKGGDMSDADKKAYKDAKEGIWPNMFLLKARLLNDGGYNKEALAVLHGKSAADFTTPAESLEFVYRVARIYDDLGRDNDAIERYSMAIQLGKNRTEYYAARAALQIGYIYEKRGDKRKAMEYYQKCIDMEDHEYENSLEQRAKGGIARCKGE